jgi:hypothetical protein
MNDTSLSPHLYDKSPIHGQASKGQALILVALAFFILLAFIGLTTDVGTLFIYMGHLRRAVDAASLAAAAQYREGRTMAEMEAAADQVMHLNGVDPGTYTITVDTCETAPADPRLCTTPRRKLTRVVSNLDVPMSFLRLVGVNDIEISADSVGEAASLDVVLVIDNSESMAWDASHGNPMRDPHLCNNTDPTGTDGLKGECQPFEEVKRAAINFTNRILNKPAASEEDRLQIVTFGNGWSSDINQGTFYRFIDYSVTPAVPRWTSDNGEAQAAINDLEVFDPGTCWDPPDQVPPTSTVHTYYGPCRSYTYTPTAMTYQWFDCLSCWDFGDWSMLPTTNTGGALKRAGNMFSYDTRQEALWIVVLLTDGMATATDREASDRWNDSTTYPIGFCPDAQDSPFPVFPLCQDENVATRHGNGNVNYDADDYARDMADFVGCLPISPSADCPPAPPPGDPPNAQGAIIFAVGLGSGVLDNGSSQGTTEANGKPYGGSLMRYVAARGYDGDASSDPCDIYANDFTQWCGNYYYAPTGPQLSRIFEDIASRIFTRLTH